MTPPASPTDALPPPPGRAPRRRWARRIGWGVLGLVGGVLLLVAGALLFLTAPAGEEWLRGKALELANEQLSGRLEAGSVDLSLTGLTLRDVKLYTPEGELVAEVALIDARLALSSLLSQHVEVKSARVERPRLYLEQDERGLNLARALEPREPKPEEPDTGRGSLRVSVKDFTLEDGYVDFESDTEEGTRQVRLEDFDARGGGSYGAAKRSFTARLEATGELTRPTTGPVKLSLQGEGEEENLSTEVELQVAGLEAVARGGMRGVEEAWAELKRLSLEPETARAVVPGWPLRVPVTVEGNAQKQGARVQANLDAKAGSATLDVDGSFHLETLRTDGITLQARDINLAELLESGPATSIVAHLTVRGGGMSLETLEGEVDFTVSPSEYRGQPLGPVELRASARNGSFQLSRLRALAPGVSLDAQGQGTLEDIELKGSLSVSNLALLGQVVNKLRPGPGLALSGSGALDFQLNGPLRAPGLELSGTFASLGYEDVLVRELNLKASAPDVTHPLTADASLQVGELRAGGRTFQDLSASLATRGRALDARVRSQGDVELSLDLAGTVDEDQEGLAVRALTLAFPETTWKLQAPTHVDFGGGRLEVKPALRLAAAGQRLSLTLEKEGPRVDGRVKVEALNLAKLPRAFVPESLGLGGTLSAEVSAQGRLPRPNATVSLHLEEGRFQQYSDLDVALRGTYQRDRAKGTLTASAPAARLTADFNVPVQGVLRRRGEALDLRVDLAHLDLAQVRQWLERPEPLGGKLAGLLEVSGTAREPRLALTLRGEGVRYDGKPPSVVMEPISFTLGVTSQEADGTLEARLDVQGVGAESHVSLQTPFTVGGLLAEPPTPEALMRAPMRLEAGLSEVPFSLLGGLAQLQESKGTVSLRLAMTGAALAPEGHVELLASGVTANGMPPLDGYFSTCAGKEDLRLALVAFQRKGEAPTPLDALAGLREGGRDVLCGESVYRQLARRPGAGKVLPPLVELSATLGAPLGALQDPEVIGWVPFELHGRLSPTPLNELPGLVSAEPELRAQGLQGTVSLELSAQGTPAAPRVVLDAGLQQLGVGKLALGQAHLHYAYAEARSRLDALITAPSGGTLLLEAGLPLELSLPALQQRELDVSRLPLEVKLLARRFDMGFLSGATEMVRSLGGVLSADAQVAGTVGAPTLQGTVKWENGRLGLMGLGEYRDIRVNLAVTEERIQLEELFARAGAGELRLTGDARLVGTRGSEASSTFQLTSQLTANDFPIVFDDQLVATLGLRGNINGTLSARNVNLNEVFIREAHVRLPEVARKDLQPLERPGDIVMVRNGVPLNKDRGRRPSSGQEPPDGGTGGAGGTGVPQRQYRMEINAPGNIWIHGTDINLEVGVPQNERLIVRYAEELAISGPVRVLQGWVSVLGRRFDLQRQSEVRFTGPPLTPSLNVTAEHTNERENVTVFITVRGQGKELQIEPTSDPPMPETEIYTLLATGRRTLERGSGASMTGAQAASVVGSLVATQAKNAIAKELPLDVFSIETGEGGLADTRLEVGTYISDKLYVGYTRGVGNTQQPGEVTNAVRVQYQFSPSWSLEAIYGDSDEGGADFGGVDLIWNNEY